MRSEIALPGKRTRWHYRQVTSWFGPLLMRLLGGWRVAGTEHIPAEGAALICPNHVSYLDPPLVGVAAVRRCCYMAKASLFKIPILGSFIRKSYSYPVDKEEGGRQAIRIATTLLKAGELVVIFPEGTRSPDGELIPGKPGPALIASRAKAPIIPAAVWGADVVLPLHSRRLYRCPVYVRFGEPMQLPEPPEGKRLSKEQLQAVTQELMGRIAELQRQVKSEVPEKWLKRAERMKAHWRQIHAGKAETEAGDNA